jgi:hypothetical protein
MYDRFEGAYLFCFKLRDGVERAIAFPSDHAGRLLQDKRAQGGFGIAITSQGLEGEEAAYLLLGGVYLKRHPQAKI